MLTVETLTFQNASAALEQGCAAIRAGQSEIDLAGIRQADSCAVAILLAWKRWAQAEGRELHYTNIPAGLQSLASVYGVDGLLTNHQH